MLSHVWVYKKINSFLSFHSPIFHPKIRKRRGTFWEEEQLTKTNVCWGGQGVHVKQQGRTRGKGGSKLEVSSERIFWMTPKWLKLVASLYRKYLAKIFPLAWMHTHTKIMSAKLIKTHINHHQNLHKPFKNYSNWVKLR